MDIEKPEEPYKKPQEENQEKLTNEEIKEVENIYLNLRRKPAMLRALIEIIKKEELKGYEKEIEAINTNSQKEIERLESIGADEMTIQAVEGAAREQRKRLIKKSTEEIKSKREE